MGFNSVFKGLKMRYFFFFTMTRGILSVAWRRLRTRYLRLDVLLTAGIYFETSCN